MKRSFMALVPLVIAAAILSPGATRADEAGRDLQMEQVDAAVIGHAVLRSLADDEMLLPRRGTERKRDVAAALGYLPLGRSGGTDPMLDRGSTALRAPDRIRSFEGISSTGFLPPDPVGDVGPDHYVMAVNPSLAVYDKTGNLLLGPTDMRVLWQPLGGPCASLGQGDPIVQYDPLASRWLVSEFAFAEPGGQPTGPFFQCIALSRSSDPLGDFDLYAFRISDDLFPDFPKFGVWPDAYYMTVHFFEETSGAYAGQGVYAFDRAKMLAGASTPDPIGFTDPQLLGVLPADMDGSTPPPSGAPNYLVAVEDDGVGFPADRLEVFAFDADFGNPAASSVRSVGTMFTASFDQNMCFGAFECLPQKGTTRRLDAIGDGIIMYRLAYRNFGSHESLVLNHVVDVDGKDRAGIRWYEIRDPATPRIHQQGTFSPDSNSRWMASMAMDKAGNIAIGYSVTGPDLFPSIRYTGRLAGDPLGTLSAEQSIVQGGGSQTGGPRWGDYTSMTVDPRDDCTFWYVQEYYPQTSPDDWHTRIANLRFPGCGESSPEPEPSSSPSTPQPSPSPSPTNQPDPAALLAGVTDRPDPFTPNGDGRKDRSKIFFTLLGDREAQVTLTVRNRRGALVRVLADQVLSPGDWKARWNGRTDAGRRAGSGKYTYRLEAVDAAGRSDVETGTVTLRR